MHLATLFPSSTFVGYDISKRALRYADRRTRLLHPYATGTNQKLHGVTVRKLYT
jgi:hypothetical protein